jgi:hypothetical protein
LETHLAAVEVQTRRRDGLNAGTSDVVVKLPKFDGFTSWPVFHGQLETMANHNGLAAQKKATYLLAIPQGQAADILHNVQVAATYKDIVEALNDRYENQLSAAY